MVSRSASAVSTKNSTNSSSSNGVVTEFNSNFELSQVRETDHPRTVLSDKTNLKTISRASQVWRYAVRHADPNYAVCCLCKDNKRISTNNGSTSTLRKHLIFKHNMRELILPHQQRKCKYSSTNITNKKQLHELLISCVIRDGRTFNDFQKSGFKKVLQELVPGHYFPANSYNLQSTILSFSTFDKQHTSIEISRILETKLKELNISQKAVRVTCDGDLVIGVDDQYEGVINVEEFEENHETNIDSMNELEFDNGESMEVEDMNDEDEESLSCMIDDEITDNWEEHVIVSDDDIVYDQEIIVNVLKKCRGLISMIKRSTILTLFFDNERKRMNIKRNLCYDVKSRWNSTYTLFELTTDDWVILAQLHLVLKPFFHATKVLSGRQYPSMGLAFHLIIRLKNFLQHHEKKTKINDKTFKTIVTVIRITSKKIQINISRCIVALHAYFDPAGFATLTDLEKRSIEQNIKNMATNEELFGSIQSITTVLPIVTMSIGISGNPPLNKTSAKSAMDMFNKSIGELNYEVNPYDENKHSTIIDDIYNYRKCVTRFNLRQKHDELSSTLFWNTYGENFSILGKLAKRMLCSPATSVPSESCFSTSAFLNRKERARLSGENLSSSVFLQDKMGF
ncbi:unnamed protein product [Rotaria sp. Silwood1]|nr:unnamed protein product [Rotaria sp. Silwood1]